MSASSAPAIRTIACELAAALERYQRDFDEMMESRMAAQQYRAVTRELDSIRLMKGAIPGLSQEMADVLIRHVQLVHSAWNAQIRLPGEELGEMKRLRVRHKLAVDTMRRKCLEAAR